MTKFKCMINKLKKLFKNNDNTDKISFKESMNLCDLPVVTFFQGDKRFNFLLDTGSNNSIIDKRVLKQMEYTPLKERSDLYGVEGIKHIVKTCSITLSFNNRDYTYNYLIKNMEGSFKKIKEATGVTIHGIIGSLFFNEFKYVLDFDKLIAYSKK